MISIISNYIISYYIYVGFIRGGHPIGSLSCLDELDRAMFVIPKVPASYANCDEWHMILVVVICMPARAFQKFHRGSSPSVNIEPSIAVLSLVMTVNMLQRERGRTGAPGAVLMKSRLTFRICWLMSMEHCCAEGCAGFSGRRPSEPKSGHSIRWWWIALHTIPGGSHCILSFTWHGSSSRSTCSLQA